MSLTITNAAGSTLTTLNIQGIHQVNPTKFVVIPLGGTDKDEVQKFGKQNRIVQLKGCASALDQKVFLENLIGNTGSIKYESDPGLIFWSQSYGLGDFDPNDFFYEDFFVYTGETMYYDLPVYFRSLNWHEIGARPMEREFTLEVVEIK